MIVLIDNYDSFVHNLARYVRELGFQTIVKRNDALTMDELLFFNPSHIILSPGPCTPADAGITLQVIRELAPLLPIFGVCLGHQAIGQAFGGEVIRSSQPTHGKASNIYHQEEGVFKQLPTPFKAGRYHSLCVNPLTLPPCLKVTAMTQAGEIMGLQHQTYKTVGVQFHPESVLTEYGHQLISNFLEFGTSRGQ
jgi:anthranilate synthase/aminodeoxychorismate synthase-like glutamine amidotransferase